MAANASRRKLVNAKATTKYLEAFFDATRIQSEANDLDRDVKHAVEQQEQLARERSNWKRSKPAKRQRTLTDSATGMTSSRKRVMGYGDRASVDAELAQRSAHA